MLNLEDLEKIIECYRDSTLIDLEKSEGPCYSPSFDRGKHKAFSVILDLLKKGKKEDGS